MGYMPDTAHLRRDYGAGQLDDAPDARPWWELFHLWFTAAAGLDQPHAVVLATADEHGRPRARNVLIKSWDRASFVWATNYDSRKGHDLAVNGYAGLCFSWIPLERQVVVEGPVSRVDPAESDAIFAARPRGAQLAAWASPQSRPLPGGRAELDARLAAVQERFGDGPVARPENWGGYRLGPERVEFWQGRPNRMHDRICYRRDGEGWMVERLAP
jgi:pyridoxamine 5'-phosphate oxidase